MHPTSSACWWNTSSAAVKGRCEAMFLIKKNALEERLSWGYSTGQCKLWQVAKAGKFRRWGNFGA